MIRSAVRDRIFVAFRALRALRDCSEAIPTILPASPTEAPIGPPALGLNS